MRICVYGAGAVGGHVAARLVEGGAEVSVVARGAHLAAIQANGLTLVTGQGDLHVRVTATDDPRTLGVQDAVLVTAKAQSLPSVAAGIGPLLGPDTPVAFVMNGVPWWYFCAHDGPFDGHHLERLDPGGTIRAQIGAERALGAVAFTACTVTSPGVVQTAPGAHSLVFGEPDGSLSPRLDAIAAPLRAGGLPVEITGRIRDVIWSKLLRNISSGVLAVLTNSPSREFFVEPSCVDAARAIYVEVQAIAKALGCAPEVNIEAQLKSAGLTTHRPSILQDLDQGRPMEIGAMFEVPLELARLVGVATPTLDMLVALCRVRVKAAGLYV
jgi:2-dehydropantoate 2-reductase